ncbi:MAG: hypothetical protein AYK23_02020 [Candidatus Proteinoplasmatales archaeon SG8-5]|nr:MAG: hypothetical protein AYK23_02020 [Candidatus Proteinoplasmatales archaeon SG8-5]
MVTGFDILTHDKRLRRHWLNRAGAFIADAFLVFIPVTFIFWYLDFTDVMMIGLITSLTFYVSSSVTEALLGATVFKLVFGMRVRPLKSERVGARAFVRNLNRLLWFVLPPIDFAVGMATGGDPRQRLLDRAAGTTVTIESQRDWHEAHLKQVEIPADEYSDGAPDGEEGRIGGTDAYEVQTAGQATTTGGDRCDECGGHLMMLADEKLQCRKCGMIQ